jgi:hypothetical protein
MKRRIELLSESNLTRSLVELIDKYQKILNQVPEEFKNDVTIESEVNEWDDEVYVLTEISYWRPETDEEKECRLKNEQRQKDLNVKKERALYEALKTKFESVK